MQSHAHIYDKQTNKQTNKQTCSPRLALQWVSRNEIGAQFGAAALDIKHNQ